MIYFNNKSIIGVFKGNTPINRIYKGTDLVYEAVKPSSTYILTVTVNTGSSVIVNIDGIETNFSESNTIEVERGKTVYYSIEFAPLYEYAETSHPMAGIKTEESGSFAMNKDYTINVKTQQSKNTITYYKIRVAEVPQQYDYIGVCNSKDLTFEESANTIVYSTRNDSGSLNKFYIECSQGYDYLNKKTVRFMDNTTPWYIFAKNGDELVWSPNTVYGKSSNGNDYVLWS